MVFEKSLTAMVKGIRAHRGKESEYINACLQEIQKEVTSKNLSTKSMAVLKLAYLNMMGYDMSWATFAIIEVMSHNRFAVKRPGYLASSLAFNENTDVSLLTINLFKKDFGSKSQYETGMAISCLSTICTPEICRDVLGDLCAMLSSSRAYLRKKTVLCLYRVFLKDPPALRTCFPKLKERLGDEDQGVLTATVNTFLELARKNARNYLSLVPQFYHILVNTTNNWLSIKLLKVFQLLVPLEPRLPTKMVEPLMNLLNTTKAQSVEFEAIRCTVRTMPDGTALMSLAMEKLQNFLNSSDRNLRFLALELFAEILEKPQFKDKVTIPDLHAKVLQSIEESDTTARKIALQLLDRIVTPASFVDTVKKLMEFSKNANPDDFLGTILRMGARDRYALVEDFAWYLLVLAEIARSLDSVHAQAVADQFTDISVRVAQVRPYAVSLALSLIDGRATAGIDGESAADGDAKHAAPLQVSNPVAGACAWLIGEYHSAFESPVEASVLKAAKAMLVPKHLQSLEPAIQTQCVWAATKLYLGSPQYAPETVAELHCLLTTHLPTFIQSTHVDVSERATLSLSLSKFFKDESAKVKAGMALFEEPLLPVHVDAQKAVPLPECLDLDEPFFPAEPSQDTFAPARADPSDPYALAATYKDDLGFLAAQDSQQRIASGVGAEPGKQSMFYLAPGKEDSAAGKAAEGGVAADGAASGPVDPLEQMRERLAASRTAGGGTKYQVMRDDLQVPGGAPAPTAAAASSGAAGSAVLPVPPEKELTELQGRLWTMSYRDDHVIVYVCVRSKNVKKQLLRLDLRCEMVDKDAAATSVSDITLRLPAGVVAQEANGSGAVVLVAGKLQERSARVKANISLAPFASPTSCALACEVAYEIAGAESQSHFSAPLEFRLPATTFLAPAVMNEDDVATYIGDHSAQLLNQQTAQALSLNFAGSSLETVTELLPVLVGRCAGLCHLHGIQQRTAAGQPSGKGQKFLLIASVPKPVAAVSGLPSQEALPDGARIVCLCAGLPKDGSLDVRLTVKACRKDVCEDVLAQLAAVLRELTEGRLKV